MSELLSDILFQGLYCVLAACFVRSLMAGTLVVLRGLVERPELNGKVGIITEVRHATKKAVVQLEEGEERRLILVSSDKLEAAADDGDGGCARPPPSPVLSPHPTPRGRKAPPSLLVACVRAHGRHAGRKPSACWTAGTRRPRKLLPAGRSCREMQVGPPLPPLSARPAWSRWGWEQHV